MLAPPQILPDAAPRLANARYVLLAKVGKGGMAGVYAAWDVREQDWRAVKVLLPKFARDKGVRARFTNEGLTMGRLAHPNLVRVFDIGSATSDEGTELPFIVMELLNGGSLHRWVKTHGKMPARLATGAGVQLLQGLEAVHAAGVVHRDVKPKNVLSDASSVLKLTDFGIAQLDASNETKTGLAMGTLGYMAPEQLHDAKSVDPRSDLYGVAATLWTLLTTRKPRDLFRLEDRSDLMTDVPEVLRPLLARCLAYEREARPSGAREVVDQLRELLFELPEDPPGTPPLSLDLGMPDTSVVSPEAFTELSLAAGPAFWGGNSGSSITSEPFSESLRRTAAATAREPASAAGGHRLGHRGFEAPAPLPEVLIGADPQQAPTERPAGSYADHRRDSDRRNEVPSYVAAPDVRDNPLPAPAPKVPRAAKALGIAGTLSTLGMVMVGAVFLLGVGIAGYVTNVVVTVRSAESAFVAQGDAFDRHVSYLDTLPDEIGALGVDSTGLRASWDAWRDLEPGTTRTLVGLAFVHDAEATALPLLPDRERSHEQELVRQRLDGVRKPTAEVDHLLGEWRAAAVGPVVEAAIGAGLVGPPPPE